MKQNIALYEEYYKNVNFSKTDNAFITFNKFYNYVGTTVARGKNSFITICAYLLFEFVYLRIGIFLRHPLVLVHRIQTIGRSCVSEV